MRHAQHLSRWTIALVGVCLLAGAIGEGQGHTPRRIYWGDEVPKAWNGTDMVSTQDGTPHLAGSRVNARGFDLNRDAVKLETPEVNGLYQNVLNRWDPLMFVGLHLMGRGKHGYANTYATSTVPAAHPGPRTYVWDTLFPAVREAVRRDFGLETFTHALADDVWPPTVWSHDNAIWSTEAKFVVSDYGLRNRMAIITETPGHPTFERRIYAQYAYVLALLEYTNAHAKDMLKVVRDADDETVARVQAQAEAGLLDEYLKRLGADERPVVYPIFKYRRIVP